MGAFEDYSSALAEFKRVNAEIDALAQSVASVGTSLGQNRAHFCFSNAAAAFPIGVSGAPQSEIFDGRDWKSAAEINAILAKWHAVKDQVKDIWRALPPDQQQALQPPPEVIVGRRRPS